MSRFTQLRNNTNQRQPVGLVFHAGEKNDGKYPKSRETLRVEGHYKARFEANHPQAPSEVTIWFPSTDLRRISQVFKEYRNSGGVNLARVCTDWTLWGDDSVGDSETFEVFRPETQRWEEVQEPSFDVFVKKYDLIEKDTLRLFFMLPEFMQEGIYALCQIETRGVQSSIPDMLNTISLWNAAGKLQVPFKLKLSKNEGKGIKKDGKGNEKHIYPILSLIPDTTPQGQIAIEETVRAFLSLAVAPAMWQRQINGQKEHKALQAVNPQSEEQREEELDKRGLEFVEGNSICEEMEKLFPLAKPEVSAPLSRLIAQWKENSGTLSEDKLQEQVNKLSEKLAKLQAHVAAQQAHGASQQPATDDGNPFKADLEYIEKYGTMDELVDANKMLDANDEAGFARILADVKAKTATEELSPQTHEQ